MWGTASFCLYDEACALQPPEGGWRYLVSEHLQAELLAWTSNVEGSSLEVERAQQQAKRAELMQRSATSPPPGQAFQRARATGSSGWRWRRTKIFFATICVL